MRTLAVLCFLTTPALAQEPAPASAQEPAAEAVLPGYHLDTGPCKPAEQDLTLGDLPIRVRYPEGVTSPAPLIIFSHGMGGASGAFAELTGHWVSHGYVVILPTHADSVRRQKPEDRREILRDPDAYRRRVDPIGRVADVCLILDSLDKIETQIPGLRLPDGRAIVDRERVGIAGHSAGAMTTQMAIGAKARTRDSLRPRSVAEPRFDAAIVISGQGTASRMFTEDSWKDISKPVLVITGSKDTAATGNETPETRQHPYRFAAAGDKYLLFIEGATHSSYQGKGRGSDMDRRLDRADPTMDLQLIGNAVMSQTLAFWDSFLKSDHAAAAYLREDRVQALGPAIKAEHK